MPVAWPRLYSSRMIEISGYASVTEEPYEMYDFYGPYMEVVDAGAFEATLAADPDVVLRFNHTGLAWASTHDGTLELFADEIGLGFRADVDESRSDIAEFLSAMSEDGEGLLRETSMAGWIVRGKWSPDYQEYRLLEFDLDRGDVAAVTFGANPYGRVRIGSGEPTTAADDADGPDQKAADELLLFRMELEAA